MATRLQHARAARFVGRKGEQALWEQALLDEGGDFAVLWIVGPGGVGKTSLLGRLATLADERGVRPALVDARHLLGSPESFSTALARALGGPEDADPLSLLAAGGRCALLVDTAEELGALELFLWERFLPALPAGCLVAFAGRTPPHPEHRRDPGWAALLRVVSLRNLSRDDSRALLRARGIAEGLHEGLIRATYGHPLALSLSADVIAQGGALDPMFAAQSPDVIGALLIRFSHDAPDALHRLALHVAAHVRITDESLLRHAVDAKHASMLYDWLSSLSFSVLGPDGLYLHDLAAHTLDVALRRRDPHTYLQMHKRVREPCVAQLRVATGAAQLRAASDLSWLHRFSPVMGGLIDWEGARSLYPDTLRASDHTPILAATERFEGPAAATACSFWLAQRPESFTLVRTAAGQTRGYICTLLLDEGDGRNLALRAADPRVDAAFTHIATHGALRPGERFSLEFWMDYETHVDPGLIVSQVSIRDIRTWLSGPGVAYSMAAICARDDLWAPLLRYLEHAPGPTAVLGSTHYAIYVHDWRAMTPTVFLDLMAEREVLGTEVSGPPPEAPLPLVLSQEDFATAVREALRAYTDVDALGANPLLRCRALLEAPAGDDHPLRRVLTLAAETLTHAGRDEPLHAALKLTYLDPARTQEEAAELLGMSFSTYRRKLSASVDRVVRYLWQRELHGYHD